MLPLMSEEHRDRFELFMLLVTRRLYNHLATAASSVDHLDHLLHRMPSSVHECRDRALAVLHTFRASEHYHLVERLRDHSIHEQLHATIGEMTIRQDPTVAEPHEGWQPTTRILLDLVPLRRSTGGRRRRRKLHETVDPIIALPDRIDLLQFVKTCQAESERLATELKVVLVQEYRQHESDVDKTRARLRVILST